MLGTDHWVCVMRHLAPADVLNLGQVCRATRKASHAVLLWLPFCSRGEPDATRVRESYARVWAMTKTGFYIFDAMRNMDHLRLFLFPYLRPRPDLHTQERRMREHRYYDGLKEDFCRPTDIFWFGVSCTDVRFYVCGKTSYEATDGVLFRFGNSTRDWWKRGFVETCWIWEYCRKQLYGECTPCEQDTMRDLFKEPDDEKSQYYTAWSSLKRQRI
jgi:hypothetical protein